MKMTMAELRQQLPQVGKLETIAVRPGRREPMVSLEEAEVEVGSGINGDRFSGKPDSVRQVTLIQKEHLTAVAGMLGLESIDPLLTRRNLVISGINLIALKDQKFSIGEVVLLGSGPCHPCSRMEEAFGPGGYKARRGHGGITARVITGGTIRVGDAIQFIDEVAG
ncbi:MAG TPA: MOSC domain-containing protein [Cytophagales bacterium]|nr:MOSC domain-containing protein [Cytophagales bacterium]